LNHSKLILSWILITAVYYLTARLGFSLAFEQMNTSPVWLPTGISIAAVLFLGLRAWPGIYLGAFFANLSTGLAVLPSLGIATGNTLEAVIAGYLILHFAECYPFRKVWSVALFAVVVMAASAISATVGVSSLFMTGVVTRQALALLWETWWLGDIVGGLILTPFLLTWVRRPDIRLYARHKVEMLALIIGTLTFAALVFGHWFDIGNRNGLRGYYPG